MRHFLAKLFKKVTNLIEIQYNIAERMLIIYIAYF